MNVSSASSASLSSIFAMSNADHDENRSSIANGANVNAEKLFECRSPFVTQDHPRCILGDGEMVPLFAALRTPVVHTHASNSFDGRPPRPRRQHTGIESTRMMSASHSTSSSSTSTLSPGHKYTQKSTTFDVEDMRAERRFLQNSVTFVVENIRKMSLEPSPQTQVVLTVRDRESGGILARRLRRLKRRLFLESVSSSQTSSQASPSPLSPQDGEMIMDNEVPSAPTAAISAVKQEAKKKTPKHSNTSTSSFTITKEIEIVVDDTTFNTTMVIESSGSGPEAHYTLSTKMSDSSETTEAPPACTFCQDDDNNRDHNDGSDHYLSLSSVSE